MFCFPGLSPRCNQPPGLRVGFALSGRALAKSARTAHSTHPVTNRQPLVLPRFPPLEWNVAACAPGHQNHQHDGKSGHFGGSAAGRSLRVGRLSVLCVPSPRICTNTPPCRDGRRQISSCRRGSARPVRQGSVTMRLAASNRHLEGPQLMRPASSPPRAATLVGAKKQRPRPSLPAGREKRSVHKNCLRRLLPPLPGAPDMSPAPS